MGLTHYWIWNDKPKPERMSACIADMKRVLKTTRVPLASGSGSGDPSVTHSDLVLNGREPDDCEPFTFPGQTEVPAGSDEAFNFCKTKWQPYDEVVTALLLVAAEHFGRSELTVDSDGEWEEWGPGRSLYERVFGKKAKNPIPSE